MAETASSPAQAYVLKSGEGVNPHDSSLKASVFSTGGMLTVIESRTTGGAPLHVHTREDEFFYVIAGTLTVRIGDDRFEAGAGAFVFLPRNIPHEWDVVGEEATLLMMTAPAGLDAFLAEFHAVDSREERNEIAAKYGITFL